MHKKHLKFLIVAISAMLSGAIFTVIGHAKSPILVPNLEIITIHGYNTVVLKSPVTPGSVAQLLNDAKIKVQNLNKSEPLFLVVNTPGGEVEEGFRAIFKLQALGREIKTISVRAYSMGFYLVQYMGERLIVPNGEIMAHPVSLQGVSGSSIGQIQSRLTNIKEQETLMRNLAASRAGISLDTFNKLIEHEYWAVGTKAVTDGFADRVVLVNCGLDLDGTHKEVETIELLDKEVPAVVDVSNCPI